MELPTKPVWRIISIPTCYSVTLNEPEHDNYITRTASNWGIF